MQFRRRENPAVSQQFKPEGGFIGLLFHDAYLRDELGSRARTARGAVIRCNGGAGTTDLISDDTAFAGIRQDIDEL